MKKLMLTVRDNTVRTEKSEESVARANTSPSASTVEAQNGKHNSQKGRQQQFPEGEAATISHWGTKFPEGETQPQIHYRGKSRSVFVPIKNPQSEGAQR